MMWNGASNDRLGSIKPYGILLGQPHPQVFPAVAIGQTISQHFLDGGAALATSSSPCQLLFKVFFTSGAPFCAWLWLVVLPPLLAPCG